MDSKPRTVRQHWRAKLTDAQTVRARQLWADGKKTQRQLADMFGVSQSAISNLLTGKTYRLAGRRHLQASGGV